MFFYDYLLAGTRTFSLGVVVGGGGGKLIFKSLLYKIYIYFLGPPYDLGATLFEMERNWLGKNKKAK